LLRAQLGRLLGISRKHKAPPAATTHWEGCGWQVVAGRCALTAVVLAARGALFSIVTGLGLTGRSLEHHLSIVKGLKGVEACYSGRLLCCMLATHSTIDAPTGAMSNAPLALRRHGIGVFMSPRLAPALP
jgi:hypothetical protein